VESCSQAPKNFPLKSKIALFYVYAAHSNNMEMLVDEERLGKNQLFSKD
jgi:hypothetical protein